MIENDLHILISRCFVGFDKHVLFQRWSNWRILRRSYRRLRCRLGVFYHEMSASWVQHEVCLGMLDLLDLSQYLNHASWIFTMTWKIQMSRTHCKYLRVYIHSMFVRVCVGVGWYGSLFMFVGETNPYKSCLEYAFSFYFVVSLPHILMLAAGHGVTRQKCNYCSIELCVGGQNQVASL